VCDACDGTGAGAKALGHGPGSLCPSCRGRKVFINKPGDEKLLKFLSDNHHDTPFEMAGMVIEVQAPIFVFREWHRHRTQSYNEMSARYTPLPDVNYIPTVERLMVNSKTNKQAGTVAGAAELTEFRANEFRNRLAALYESAETLYQEALSDGVPKELARVHLPVGRYSRMRASANLRNWLAFLTLRMDSKAQYEIRMYANAVGNLIAERFPRTWEVFSDAFERRSK
jgi:thymidylate synthase (FAD)